MNRILNLAGMTAGGGLGWAMGARVSIFTAFVVSVLGTAPGLYLAQRVTRALLP